MALFARYSPFPQISASNQHQEIRYTRAVGFEVSGLRRLQQKLKELVVAANANHLMLAGWGAP